MSSGPKRTFGVVTFVGERFGFIELTNKNIPVSKVYFDFSSFDGKGSDLSKIYPIGTNVNFTFIESPGEHKVRHRAINLTKANSQKGILGPGPKQGGRGGASQSHVSAHPQHRSGPAAGFPDPRSQYPHGGPRPYEGGPSHRGRGRGRGYPHQQVHHGPTNPHRGGANQRGGQGRGYPRQQPHHQHQYEPTKPSQHHQHQRPQRQNSRNSGVQDQGATYGGAYPHEQLFFEQPSTPGATNSSVGQILRDALATGLTKLAEKISDQPTASTEQQIATAAPQPQPSAPNPGAKSRRKGKKQGNREKQRKESLDDAPGKAFNDQGGDTENAKKPMQCSEDSDVKSDLALDGHFTAQAVPQLAQEPGKSPVKKQDSRKQKDKLFRSPEANTFKNLLGKELGVALKNKLVSTGVKSLNNLLLLRLAVGKQPNIRIFTNNETSNHAIDDVKSIELEDLQRLLRHNDVIKSLTPLHYGIKGTLHSIRTIEQNGKVTGLTLFCQLHEEHDGLGFEILKRKSLTAVVGDISTCPQKYFYNYLRCKSQEMAKSKDVLVLDVDGQLSGCDETPHPSLGDVTRISCSSSSEVPNKITEAIEHLHECAIAIGVDSTAALQALQKMASKGARIIAEISPDMKAEAETIFAE